MNCTPEQSDAAPKYRPKPKPAGQAAAGQVAAGQVAAEPAVDEGEEELEHFGLPPLGSQAGDALYAQLARERERAWRARASGEHAGRGGGWGGLASGQAMQRAELSS